MRGNKLFLFIVIILGLIVITPAFAQRTSKQEKFNENHSPFGRRKKERANMRHSLFAGKKLFRRGKSHGNADDFASNSGHAKRGFLSRVFSRGGGSERNASLRKTTPVNFKNRKQKGLFHGAEPVIKTIINAFNDIKIKSAAKVVYVAIVPSVRKRVNSKNHLFY